MERPAILSLSGLTAGLHGWYALDVRTDGHVSYRPGNTAQASLSGDRKSPDYERSASRVPRRARISLLSAGWSKRCRRAGFSRVAMETALVTPRGQKARMVGSLNGWTCPPGILVPGLHASSVVTAPTQSHSAGG